MLVSTQRSGTAADKVSAFAVLVGDNPIANLRSLDALLGKFSSRVSACVRFFFLSCLVLLIGFLFLLGRFRQFNSDNVSRSLLPARENEPCIFSYKHMEILLLEWAFHANTTFVVSLRKG